MNDKIDIRVQYSDSDQMGMVYYSRYLEWFERGRNEFMRNAGLPYIDIERQGVFLPVIEAHAEYKRNAKYDDFLILDTCITEFPGATVRFEYEIKCDDLLITTGYTIHCFLGTAGKSIRPPRELKSRISALLKRRVS